MARDQPESDRHTTCLKRIAVVALNVVGPLIHAWKWGPGRGHVRSRSTEAVLYRLTSCAKIISGRLRVVGAMTSLATSTAFNAEYGEHLAMLTSRLRLLLIMENLDLSILGRGTGTWHFEQSRPCSAVKMTCRSRYFSIISLPIGQCSLDNSKARGRTAPC